MTKEQKLKKAVFDYLKEVVPDTHPMELDCFMDEIGDLMTKKIQLLRKSRK